MRPWKEFERLVAAIHRAQQQGAAVTWDEHIGGRQFDVTLKFRAGFYEYLTLIECRDTAEPVPIGDVDAFVTKSQDAKASKAVMVSRAGFQSGARKVAQRHGVELLTLREVDDLPPEMIARGLTPLLQQSGFHFVGPTGEIIGRLCDTPGRAQYLVNETRIRTPGGGGGNLAALLRSQARFVQSRLRSEPTVIELSLPPGSRLTSPEIDNDLEVAAVRFTIELVSVQVVDTGGLDTSAIPRKWRVDDVLGERTELIDAGKLDFGTTWVPGRYYRLPDLDWAYLCEAINGDLATICLVESYQHGRLFQVRGEVDVKYACHYIEITDAADIARLTTMYEKVVSHDVPQRNP